jgi:predicted signal transduction protein with EAL and GGDEF domain
VACAPEHGWTYLALLRHADVAMYAAKEGGSSYEIYDELIDRHKPELVRLVSQVRLGIDEGQFRMYFQPKVHLDDGRVAGAEALIRWHHPSLGRRPTG